MTLTIDTKLKLNSGYEIPQLGFGVYQTYASKHAILSVLSVTC